MVRGRAYVAAIKKEAKAETAKVMKDSEKVE
jgi:hypothetical protein